MRKVLLFLIFFLLTINVYSKNSNYFYKKFNETVKQYRKLKTNSIKNKRRYSTRIIQSFYYIYNSTRSNKLKAKSLFLIGRTYYYLAIHYESEVFTDLAIGSFYRLVKEFPRSTLCDDAKYYSAQLYYYYKNIPKIAIEQLEYIFKYYPRGDYNKRAKKFLKAILKKHPELKKKIIVKKHIIRKNFKVVKRIRTFALKQFSRIVFDLTGMPKFIVKKYSKNRTINIKLKKTALSKYFKIVPINQNSIDEKLTIKQFKNSLVITYNSWKIRSLNYFTLKNPYRIVIDIEEGITKRFITPHETIKTIVIDAGHGGKDPGATYYGLQEKDVALKISKLVRYYLKRILKSKKYNILLTREDDVFLSLEERAEFANENNADLFISIHCNASPNPRLYGIETYYLDFNKNNPFITKVSGDVNTILEDLIRTAKLDESVELANFVQHFLIKNLKARYKYVHNLGVKEAPFYVLLGTRMPSILVETSFLSNRRENRRLRNRYYLSILSKSIAEGIARYIKSQKFVK